MAEGALEPFVEEVPAPSRAVDRLLDLSVVGGFSRVGYAVRALPPIQSSMAGRRVLITGATGGIGLAAATGLARLGADLVLVGRRPQALEGARDRVRAAGAGEVWLERADLSLMAEVDALAHRLLAKHDHLHVLVNNVGALFPAKTLTAEGLESTLALNLLGQYLLTERLLPLLTGSVPARIINVSSGGMYTEPLDVERLLDPRPYRGAKAYARTKRAQVVLARVWAERLAAAGVVSHSMHPGWADTHGVRESLPGFRRLSRPILRTPEQGADTVVWLAADPAGAGASGLFWHDRRPRPLHRLDRTRRGDHPGRLVEALHGLASGLVHT